MVIYSLCEDTVETLSSKIFDVLVDHPDEVYTLGEMYLTLSNLKSKDGGFDFLDDDIYYRFRRAFNTILENYKGLQRIYLYNSYGIPEPGIVFSSNSNIVKNYYHSNNNHFVKINNRRSIYPDFTEDYVNYRMRHNDIIPSDCINREIDRYFINNLIKNGNTTLIKKYLAAFPQTLDYNIEYNDGPYELAVDSGNGEMVEFVKNLINKEKEDVRVQQKVRIHISDDLVYRVESICGYMLSLLFMLVVIGGYILFCSEFYS